MALLSLLSLLGYAQEASPVNKSRIWEHAAIGTYSNLNTSLNGELTPVFRSLGDFGELYQYFDQDRHPEKYEAYRQFLVQAFFDAKHGDVGEAMFASVVLELTPPNILLQMITPEIGKDGKLSGLLDGTSDVAKHIQLQNQQGYSGEPNFDNYVYYLRDNSNQGYNSLTNADIIVEHMFRAEPLKALTAMLWADYGFQPYARGNSYLRCKNEASEVRKLQQIQADIRDYLYRSKYSLPVEEGKEENIKSHLKALSQHPKAWVRLYLVCLVEKERQLRFSGIINSLVDDPDERVQAAVARIMDGHSPYWKD